MLILKYYHTTLIGQAKAYTMLLTPCQWLTSAKQEDLHDFKQHLLKSLSAIPQQLCTRCNCTMLVLGHKSLVRLD